MQSLGFCSSGIHLHLIRAHNLVEASWFSVSKSMFLHPEAFVLTSCDLLMLCFLLQHVPAQCIKPVMWGISSFVHNLFLTTLWVTNC